MFKLSNNNFDVAENGLSTQTTKKRICITAVSV